MISDAALAAALKRGILTAEQAASLEALSRELAAVTAENAPDGVPPQVRPYEDDEKLRFVSGFGDIFVAIGLVLFLGSAAYFAREWATAYLPRGWLGLLGATATTAILSWLLAEFFTRRRRMALPSIVLLIAFAVASLMSLRLMLPPHPGRDGGFTVVGWLFPALWNFSLGSPSGRPAYDALAAFGAVGLVALHYWRFRVPITIAAGAAALATAAFSVCFLIAPQGTMAHLNLLLALLGLAIFAAAMRFDLADPLRLTRATDIAFWLHLLAAPMIVHSVMRGIIQDGIYSGTGPAIAILAIFLALGLVAVLVDRRAMLVSGLVYAGAAFGILIESSGLGGNTVPLTVLVLGAFVLLLSAGWRPLRAALLRLVPADLARRLPHPV